MWVVRLKGEEAPRVVCEHEYQTARRRTGSAFWGQGCYVEEKTQAIASSAVMTHDYHNMFSVALLTTMRYYGTQEETFAGEDKISMKLPYS